MADLGPRLLQWERQSPGWTCSSPTLCGSSREAQLGLASQGSLGLNHWGADRHVDGGWLTATNARILADRNPPHSRGAQPAALLWPGSSVGSSAWFKSPSSEPASWPHSGRELNSRPRLTADSSVASRERRKPEQRLWAAAEPTLQSCCCQAPGQQSCPTVKYSLWPPITKQPEQWPWAAQTITPPSSRAQPRLCPIAERRLYSRPGRKLSQWLYPIVEQSCQPQLIREPRQQPSLTVEHSLKSHPTAGYTWRPHRTTEPDQWPCPTEEHSQQSTWSWSPAQLQGIVCIPARSQSTPEGLIQPQNPAFGPTWTPRTSSSTVRLGITV